MNPSKTKQPQNIAAGAFPEQFKRLRPERTPASGLKARSGGEARRMEVYNAIAVLFKLAHQVCECNAACYGSLTEHVHHVRGRAGLLLFDVAWFLPVCAACHRWIEAHPAEAEARGWLEKRT